MAQMLVMVPVCYLVARPRLEWGTAKTVFPLAVVNILNVVCGLIGRLNSAQILHMPVSTVLCLQGKNLSTTDTHFSRSNNPICCRHC